MAEQYSKLSELLSHHRGRSRRDAAKALLDKIKINLVVPTRDDIDVIGRGILKGLQSVKSNMDIEYCGNLIELINSIAESEYSLHLVEIFTQLLDELHILLSVDNLSPFKTRIERAISRICSPNVQKVEDVEQVDRVISMHYSQVDKSDATLLFLRNKEQAYDRVGSGVVLSGAGAILGTSLAYTGWKFPPFLLDKGDEGHLFDLVVQLQLRHRAAMGKAWDALTDFPVHALLAKTGILHFMLDVVGSTFTQADVDADPEGVNPLSAMRWLTKLLLLAQKAYEVQLNGTLCSTVPKLDTPSPDDSALTDDSEASRYTAALAHQMQALRHPLLPSGDSSAFREGEVSADLGAASVTPVPSVAGLAFACCAASLPLLQSKDVAVGQCVMSLLRAALPMVVELGEVRLSAEGRVPKTACSRLQHLLDRAEQLISFYGEEPVFSMDALLAAFRADAEDDKGEETALREGAFGLSFLSILIDLFSAIPEQFIAPAASHHLDSGLLRVGQHTVDLLSKLVVWRSSLSALLPSFGGVFGAVLRVHDETIGADIARSEKLVENARLFCAAQINRISAVTELNVVTNFLLTSAESCVCLFDATATGDNDFGVGEALAVELKSLAEVLPLLTLAAICHREAGDDLEDVFVSLKLIERLATCGTDSLRFVLLSQLYRIACGTAELGPFQAYILDRLEIDLADSPLLLDTISTPAFVRSLLLSCVFRPEADVSGSEEAAGLRAVAVLLVDAICKFVHEESDRVQWSEWVDLLCPLKLLEWQCESSSAPREGGIGSIASQLTRSAQLQASTLFVHDLQDFCAGSASVSHRQAYHRSLLLGTFHQDATTRIAFGMRLHREVLGKSEAALSLAKTASRATNAYGADFDPFHSSSPLQLETMGATRVDRDIRTSTRGTFSVSRLHELEAIVFAPGLDFDLLTTRSAALDQLITFLSDDETLLHNCSLQWLLALTRNVVAALTAISDRFSECKDATIARSSVSTRSTNPDSISISSEECQFLKSLVVLFAFLVVNVAEIRLRAVFDERHDASTISMVTPLKYFLDTSLLKRTSVIGIANEMHEAEVFAGRHCGHALSVVCLSSEVWTFPTTDFLTASYATAAAVEPGHKHRQHVAAVVTPAFLAASFRGIKPLAASSPPCSYSWSPARLVVSAKTDSYLPPLSLLAAVLKETDAGDRDLIRAAVVQELSLLIAGARSHAGLRSAMQVTESLARTLPPLFALFLDLGQSPTTAVSNVVFNPPKSLKDHWTLAAALRFLTSVFQQLQLYGHLPMVVNELNHSVPALVDAMSAYFEENVSSQYQKKFKTSEDEQRFDQANQAVQLRCLELLHVLSAFTHPSLVLGDSLQGSHIWSHCLLRILCNEAAPSHSKSLVSGFVENCVKYHGGLGLIESVRVSTGEGAVELIVRSVRLLRLPNSMQNHHTAVANLRILYLLLLQLSSAGESPTLAALASRPVAEWRFLVRMSYDRRAEVKLLALKTLSILFKFVKSADANDKSFLNDSLNEETAAANPDEEDADTSAEEVAPPREDLQWPPYDVLYTLMTDAHESRAVRVAAIRAVVQCVAAASREKVLSSREGVNHLVIIRSLSELLSLSSAQADAFSLDEALEALSALLVHAVYNGEIVSDVLALLQSLKVLPLVVDVLRDDLLKLLLTKAQDRVSSEPVLIVHDDDAIRYDSEYIILDEVASETELSDALSNRWIAAGRACKERYHASVRLAQTSACRVLLILHELSQRPHSGHPTLLADCVRHSPVVRNVMNNLSSVDETHDPSASEQSMEFELVWYQAHVDLLSVMVTDRDASSAAVPVSGGGGGVPVLYKFITDHVDAVDGLVKQLVLYLRYANTHGPQLLRSDRKVFTKCFDSVFYLLSALLSDQTWRAQLCLGGPFPHCEISQLSKYLFSLILAFRECVMALSSDSLTALVTKIDLTISLFLQHSHPTREMVSLNDEFADEDSSSSTTAKQCLVAQCLEVVHFAADFLSNPKNAQSTPAAEPARAGAVSSSASVTSDASTVNRNKAPGATTAAKGRAAVRASVSSFGSRASTQPSKFRERSRGFDIKDIRKDGPSKVNLAAIEFSPDFRLKLFNAILILTYALPDNGTGMALSSECRLHLALQKLLPYAEKHSQSVLYDTSSLLSQLRPSQTTAGRGPWRPSSGQIAASVFALCCAYSYEHSTNKTLLLNAGEAQLSVEDSGASNGQVLRRLISLGNSQALLTPVRWLSLSLAGSLLSTGRLANASLGKNLATSVAAALQHVTHNSTREDTDSVYFLLNCLAGLIGANSERLGVSSLSSQNLFYDTNASGLGKDGIKLEPFVSLITWVSDVFGCRPSVAFAICRCLGVVVSPVLPSNGGGSGSASVSSTDRTRRATGTNLSNLMGEGLIKVLCDNATQHPNAVVCAAAATSLWSITHQSEKASSAAREILGSMGSETAGFDSRTAAKANQLLGLVFPSS